MAKSEKQPKANQSVSESPVVPVTAKVEEPLKAEAPSAPIIPAKPVYRKEMDVDLPFEERITAFLEAKTGVVRINDFLKSLFPLPKMNEIPQWSTQGASKGLKGVLTKMGESGKINIVGNTHRKLGSPYYTPDQRQHHHNLSTVKIEVIL